VLRKIAETRAAAAAGAARRLDTAIDAAIAAPVDGAREATGGGSSGHALVGRRFTWPGYSGS
jgi:hypothetical protein